MKNTNLMKTNLFMHDLASIIRAHVNRERFGANWSDLIQNTWEKDWKRSLKSNIQKSSMPWICSSFVALTHSLYDQECKPNALRLQAAQKINIQTCKNSQKAQIWNQGSSSIQASIFIPLASWSITERFSIININQNALNWYP